MFGLDPLLIIALLAVAVVAVVALALLMARRRGTHGRTQQMGREDSISYFRDYSGSAPGVQEEDGLRRWGDRGDRHD